jgi:hypothetical protein
VLCAALVVVFARGHEALRFELGAAESGVVGAWIAAPATAPLPIRFSDGSALRLSPGGRARVAAVEAEGAEVALERGELDLSVVHRAGTRWRVHVGPFLVRVVGTRFSTSWDPVSERFSVALREGAITVSGPVVGESRVVKAGERITVSTATNTLDVGSIEEPHAAVAPAPSASASADVPAAAAEAGAPALNPEDLPDAAVDDAPRAHTSPAKSASVARRDAPPRAAQVPPASAPRTWQAFAADGDYRRALAEADNNGFNDLCESSSSADLLTLSDAARLGGHPGGAAAPLLALRRRFPGTADAAVAAFHLGRLAKSYTDARRWFERYLAEQPNGQFADEAAGRLLEITDRGGDAEVAKIAAERYLREHPSGSYRKYAREVLAREAR